MVITNMGMFVSPLQAVMPSYVLVQSDVAKKGYGLETVYKSAKDILRKAHEEVISCERGVSKGVL
jgi:hypothetical protein